MINTHSTKEKSVVLTGRGCGIPLDLPIQDSENKPLEDSIIDVLQGVAAEYGYVLVKDPNVKLS